MKQHFEIKAIPVNQADYVRHSGEHSSLIRHTHSGPFHQKQEAESAALKMLTSGQFVSAKVVTTECECD